MGGEQVHRSCRPLDNKDISLQAARRLLTILRAFSVCFLGHDQVVVHLTGQWASETMHQVASDLNKAKREQSFDAVVADWDHRDCPTGDSLQKDIFRWLSPPDPWGNHHDACNSRHHGAGEWFIEGNTFSEWKTSGDSCSLLWVHGKRMLIHSFCDSTETKSFFCFAVGAGKSVLWYVKLSYFHLENLSSSAPQSSTTSVPCRKLDSRHWHFSTAIIGMTERKDCADCSHPS